MALAATPAATCVVTCKLVNHCAKQAVMTLQSGKELRWALTFLEGDLLEGDFLEGDQFRVAMF